MTDAALKRDEIEAPDNAENLDNISQASPDDEVVARRVTVAPPPDACSPRAGLASSPFELTNFDKLIADADLPTRRELLMDPLPEGTYINCLLVRERTGMTKLGRRFLFKTDNGTFLAASKKVGGLKPYYLVSLDDSDLSREGLNYVGKVRSNFMGSEFVAYDAGENFKAKKSPRSMSPRGVMGMLSPRSKRAPPKSADADPDGDGDDLEIREEMVVVRYNVGDVRADGPRTMQIILPHVEDGVRNICKPASEQEPGLAKLLDTQKKDAEPAVCQYVNLPAVWHEPSKTFVLNFNNRVKAASVKNFQLIRPDNPDLVYMQFGRITPDCFALDFGHPLSPFQAFSIALSSCDYKMCTA